MAASAREVVQELTKRRFASTDHHRSVALIEPVEPRLLLSATHHPKHITLGPQLPAGPTPSEILDTAYFTAPTTAWASPIPASVAKKKAKSKVNKASVTTSTTPPPGTFPSGYSPAQMQTAYGVSSISFNGSTGNGAGETIAIVDAYDDPTAVSDLKAFDLQFGLTTPTLTIYGQSANESTTFSTATLPGTDPAGPVGTRQASDWEMEESLDIQWAHAMAPQANIDLYETLDPSNLYYGVLAAAANPSVNVVSMSWGGGEFSQEASDDFVFTTPSGHTPVTFVASTGDTGYYVNTGTSASPIWTIEPEFPAASPNVVAVGGTTLDLDSTGDILSEIGWGDGSNSHPPGGDGGGGGISAYEPKPGYQDGVDTISSTKRTTPDVAMDADPTTGVPIYDAYDFGASTPWLQGMEGGTSLAAPMFAALVAIADQGRAQNGLSALDGPTQTLPRLYALPGSDYHDITSGNNGYAAGTGYDLVTGRGSPVANQLVNDLAGVSNLAGTMDVLTNGNVVPFSNQTVYLDLNNTGSYNSYDPSVTTNSLGAFSFSDIPVSSSVVRPFNPPSSATAIVPSYTTAYDTTTYVDAASNDSDTVRINPSNSNQLQILVNGTVTYAVNASSINALSLEFTGNADTATFDLTSGNSIPTGGARFNGGASGDGDTLAIIGTTSNNTITVNSSQILFGASTISYVKVPNLSVNPNGGTDSLTVNANTVTVPASTGTGILARNFSALSVAAGATLRFNNATLDANRTVVVVNNNGLAVSSSGRLDLNANDMIVHGGSLSTITALLASGYANGAWNGEGIASLAASNDSSRITALGALQNSINGSALFSTFDGITVSTSDVLIKHTYYGDANLDGKVNGDDYSLLDNGFNTQATGWLNGDFNYSNSITTADYILTDNAFNMQGAPL